MAMQFVDEQGLARVWGKVTGKLDGKVDKVIGKDLSTNDYTTAEKQKLAAITNIMSLKGRVDAVSDLPAAAEIGDVYLVGLAGAAEFEEYVWTTANKWEMLGGTEIDLSGYVKKTDYATTSAVGVAKFNSSGFTVSSGAVSIKSATAEQVTAGTAANVALTPSNITGVMASYGLAFSTDIATMRSGIAKNKSDINALETSLSGITALTAAQIDAICV